LKFRLGALSGVGVVVSAAMLGCVGSSNGAPGGGKTTTPGDDGGQPVFSADGSVIVDGATHGDAGEDAAPGFDAGTPATFVTGLGPSVVSRSAHFTLITKTGDEPGGAGVKSSASFKLISGGAPASTK
jgi:hypothetical protein